MLTDQSRIKYYLFQQEIIKINYIDNFVLFFILELGRWFWSHKNVFVLFFVNAILMFVFFILHKKMTLKLILFLV